MTTLFVRVIVTIKTSHNIQFLDRVNYACGRKNESLKYKIRLGNDKYRNVSEISDRKPKTYLHISRIIGHPSITLVSRMPHTHTYSNIKKLQTQNLVQKCRMNQLTMSTSSIRNKQFIICFLKLFTIPQISYVYSINKTILNNYSILRRWN